MPITAVPESLVRAMIAGSAGVIVALAVPLLNAAGMTIVPEVAKASLDPPGVPPKRAGRVRNAAVTGAAETAAKASAFPNEDRVRRPSHYPKYN